MNTITRSKEQTKEWRKMQNWYTTGKHNECEKYQKKMIEKITEKQLQLTKSRINMENNSIEECIYPMKHENGYEFTENFDGVQTKDDKTFYYNLKFVCDSGGAQTRTLRETYLFIKYQINFLLSNSQKNIYFVNILDGDACYKALKYFDYLLTKNKSLEKYIFYGDTYKFKEWWGHVDNTKKNLGQFYTTNTKKILQGFEIPKDIIICEPFTGTGELIEYAKSKGASKFEMYDIDPKYELTIERDTLNDPPNFSGKFIFTNPPYLARNKSLLKTVYDKYNQNDLYKCFIRILINNVCEGGIIIIPLNFWSSIRKCDQDLRRDFLNIYSIDRVNAFEERVFDDTSYTICSFLFRKNKNNKVIPFHFFPSNKVMYFCMKNSLIGGEIYEEVKSDYIVKRWVSEENCNTCIILNALDSGSVNGKNISLEISDTPIKSKESDRTRASIIITPEISLERQVLLVKQFNEYINAQRLLYNSMFLSNYRESKDFARKRISFDLVYTIIKRLLMT